MGAINRVPFGLQSLLGSQNFGKNPAELAETTIPTLELDKFLNYELLDSAWSSSIFAVANDVITHEVPEGEAWQPLHVASHIIGIAAGERFSFKTRLILGAGGSLAVANLGGQSIVTHTSTDISDNYCYESYTPPVPYIVGPGSKFQFILVEDAVTAVTGEFSVLFNRYKI